jgi:hypothetical protein
MQHCPPTIKQLFLCAVFLSLFIVVYSPALYTLLATVAGQSFQLDIDVVFLLLPALPNFSFL